MFAKLLDKKDEKFPTHRKGVKESRSSIPPSFPGGKSVLSRFLCLLCPSLELHIWKNFENYSTNDYKILNSLVLTLVEEQKLHILRNFLLRPAYCDDQLKRKYAQQAKESSKNFQILFLFLLFHAAEIKIKIFPSNTL